MVPPLSPPRRRRDSAYVQVAITPDRPDGCGPTRMPKLLLRARAVQPRHEREPTPLPDLRPAGKRGPGRSGPRLGVPQRGLLRVRPTRTRRRAAPARGPGPGARLNAGGFAGSQPAPRAATLPSAHALLAQLVEHFHGKRVARPAVCCSEEPDSDGLQRLPTPSRPPSCGRLRSRFAVLGHRVQYQRSTGGTAGEPGEDADRVVALSDSGFGAGPDWP